MRRLSILAAAILMVGCGSGGGSGGSGASSVAPSPPLAALAIDTQGGTAKVNDPSSSYDGTSVNIPAGAVTQPTTITINTAQPLSVGTLPVELGPNGTTFTKPVALVLPYPATLLQELGKSDDAQDLMVISQDANGNVEVHPSQQIGARLVDTTTTHFTLFEVLFPRQYKLFRQPYRLIDETPEPYEVGITHLQGSLPLVTTEYHPVLARGPSNQTVVLGKGTTTDFFASGQGNVLLIHGFLSSPTTFYFNDQVQANDNDLLLSLRNATGYKGLFRNIILYQYPSRKHIAENAEQLDALVRKNAKPGCKMTIIAHSMGGLVARYAIETLDLSPYVDKLITLGTPHEGGQISYFADYYADSGFLYLPTLLIRLPGLHDLLPGNGFFKPPVGKGINERFPDHKLPTTEYYVIAGKQDPATGDDKLVTVGSATSTYLQVPLNHQAIFDNAEHSELHSKARTNGVLIKIREWVTGQPNRAPVVNAGTDQAVIVNTQVTLTGSATDPDLDTLTYLWQQTGGAAVTLGSTTTATATFTPTQIGAYTFQLTANDTVATGTDTVTITVNAPPPPPFTTATVVLTDDTYIESTFTQQQNNYGGLDTLIAGPTGPSSIWTYQTFLRFELQSAIPAGATILSATLTCTALSTTSASIDCYDANTTWSEYFLTWNSRYGTALQGVPGTYLGTMAFTGTTGTFDATAYFQAQATTGITAGRAFSFAFDRAYGNSAVSFASKERTASTPPTLAIEWR